MIAANKNPALDVLLYIYIRTLFKNRFSGVYVRGLEHYRDLDRNKPVICLANHHNWWDGLVAFYLSRYNWRKKGYCMMEEKQLRHYQFFTWLGAFSVDLSNPLRAAASVRYTMDLLQKPETLVWIFPQGKIVPSSTPIQAKEGTSFMANHLPKVQLLPVAFRYEFFRDDKPVVMVQIGKPFSGKRPMSDGDIGDMIRQEYALVDASARAQDLTGFKPIVAPALPINKRWEWFLLLCQGRLDKFHSDN